MSRARTTLSRLSIATAIAVFAAAAAFAGPAWLKLGGVKGESTATGDGKEIEVLSFSFDQEVDVSGLHEGGEAAREMKIPGRTKFSNVTLKRGVEPAAKPANPEPAEPGKLEIPNLTAAPSPSVTLVVPAGTCVLGARYPAVTLRSEGIAYELSDVTVAKCGPASAARGKKTQTQKLQYLKVEMKEILVSG